MSSRFGVSLATGNASRFEQFCSTSTSSEYWNWLNRSALETANTDAELKTILGENIEQGPLYAVTMGVDREGNSANCSFPVTGSLAKGNLHLRAVRYEGRVTFSLNLLNSE